MPPPARHCLNPRPRSCLLIPLRRSASFAPIRAGLRFRQARFGPQCQSALCSQPSLSPPHRPAQTRRPCALARCGCSQTAASFCTHTGESGLADSVIAAQAHITTGRHISTACYGNARSSLAFAAPWKCAGLEEVSCSAMLSARSLHRLRSRRSGYDARSCASVPTRRVGPLS